MFSLKHATDQWSIKKRDHTYNTYIPKLIIFTCILSEYYSPTNDPKQQWHITKPHVHNKLSSPFDIASGREVCLQDLPLFGGAHREHRALRNGRGCPDDDVSLEGGYRNYFFLKSRRFFEGFKRYSKHIIFFMKKFIFLIGIKTWQLDQSQPASAERWFPFHW